MNKTTTIVCVQINPTFQTAATNNDVLFVCTENKTTSFVQKHIFLLPLELSFARQLEF
jgi:hypothetical protein